MIYHYAHSFNLSNVSKINDNIFLVCRLSVCKADRPLINHILIQESIVKTEKIIHYIFEYFHSKI